jgi:hypothetical protein
MIGNVLRKNSVDHEEGLVWRDRIVETETRVVE